METKNLLTRWKKGLSKLLGVKEKPRLVAVHIQLGADGHYICPACGGDAVDKSMSDLLSRQVIRCLDCNKEFLPLLGVAVIEQLNAAYGQPDVIPAVIKVRANRR
jgi:hypothetical protein